MPKAKPLPPLTFLNECFRLVDDSKLFWRDERPLEHFQSEHGLRMWTSRFKGKEAGNVNKATGYRIVYASCNGTRRTIKAHRLVWALHHQDLPCPTLEVDHIDGDVLNNHVSNLRLVSHSDNMRNTRMYSCNTSGVNGVSWNKEQEKWKAYILINRKRKHLGTFDTIKEAAAARKAADIEHGYTDRHGEKA